MAAMHRLVLLAIMPLTAALRAPLIAGNWKCNPATVDDAVALATALHAAAPEREVVVFPPSPYLEPVAHAAQGAVALGAQDACELSDAGAFTGATSFPMLESLGGVTYVLAGHSERRSLFGDDDAVVKDKVRKTLDAGFAPMVCIGETREEYELGITDDVCAVQLCKALTGVTAAELERVVVAYEPVWAIGTGLTCPPKVAQKVHERIRGRLATMYSQEAADGCRVLYGGSVTPATIDALMAMADVDGALVGGASLDAAAFAKIAGFTERTGWWRTKRLLKKLRR